MHKVAVVGMGPGKKKYMTVASIEKIEESDIVVTSKRGALHLADILRGKKLFFISADLKESVEFILANRNESKIAILLSGDSCFYSMLNFLSRYIKSDEMEILNGISSIQYMFSKIGKCYDSAVISSVHGKEFENIRRVFDGELSAFLTDKENNPQKIAKFLVENGENDAVIYIGENLSYEDECISSGKASEIAELKKEYNINAVIIERIKR